MTGLDGCQLQLQLQRGRKGKAAAGMQNGRTAVARHIGMLCDFVTCSCVSSSSSSFSVLSCISFCLHVKIRRGWRVELLILPRKRRQTQSLLTTQDSARWSKCSQTLAARASGCPEKPRATGWIWMWIWIWRWRGCVFASTDLHSSNCTCRFDDDLDR